MPNPNIEQVDVRGPRFTAWVTTAVVIVALGVSAVSATAAAVILGLQAVVFAIGAVGGPRSHPYGRVFAAVVAPRLGPVTEHPPAALATLATAYVISVVQPKKALATNAKVVSMTALPAKALPVVMHVLHVETSNPVVIFSNRAEISRRPVATLTLPAVTSVVAHHAAISLPASPLSASPWV